MSYSFPKGKTCVLINALGESLDWILRTNKSFTLDDVFSERNELIIEKNDPDTLAILGPIADKLQKEGKTVFFFYGRYTREIYLVAFSVSENESEFD